jgi:phosphohistidine phosphatase
MKLYVIRHGIAEDHGPDGGDAGRRLTHEGVVQTTQAARGLSRLIEPPEAILTSPKVRAKHTAEIVGEALGVKPAISSHLADGPATAVLNALAKREDESAIIVGHQPTLGDLIETLLFGEPRGAISMRTASCAALIVDWGARHARLMWLATPEMLGEIGRGA